MQEYQILLPKKKTRLSFVAVRNDQQHSIGIDAIGFKSAFSQYYGNRTANSNSKKRRTFIKSTISADTNRQMICHAKIRHFYIHDNVDFMPVVSAIQNLPVSLGVADKGYDDEKNHQFVRECLLANSIIPTRLRYNLFGKLMASIENR